MDGVQRSNLSKSNEQALDIIDRHVNTFIIS